jgi:UDP-3-O-[3-hydroxymyristoyl] glucosamine N-acyltransferase
MQLKLSDICRRVALAYDDGLDLTIHGVNALDAAGPSELAFAEAQTPAAEVAASRAGAIVVAHGFDGMPGRRLLSSPNPRLTFVKISELFLVPEPFTGVDPRAAIDPSALLGEGVGIGPCAVVGASASIGARTRIGPGAVIGPGVCIGADCLIGPNVSVLAQARVGDRCTLHAGTTVGGDGFGFIWAGDHHHKVPQLGTVSIEDDVEIGCNSCVDRATFGTTRIGCGTKIDNLVQVAHNVDVGEHVILVSQAGLAGSVTLGRGAMLSGQVAVTDHVRVGAGARIGGQSGVTADVDAGAVLFGTPARPLKQAFREQAALARLPELLKTVRRQEAAIASLERRLRALEGHSGPAPAAIESAD